MKSILSLAQGDIVEILPKGAPHFIHALLYIDELLRVLAERRPAARGRRRDGS